MSKRRIKDEAEAVKCLAEVVASGLTLAGWSRLHGIDGRSLHSWRLNLARRDLDTPKMVEWVPRGPCPTLEAGPGPRQERGRYTIWCGEIAVQVDDHFNADTLLRLLRAVTTC
jgi:hypothetical protein